MQVIILAAGLGRRMMPLTRDCHKTLIPVGGRAILGRIIDVLLACGLRRIAIVTGYRHEDLEAYLAENYTGLELSFIHNDRYASTNNIFSLALAFEQLPDDDILLIESDLLFEAAVIKRLLASPHPDVALVDHYQMGMDGTVVTVEDGQVTRVIPPHLQSAQFDFSNKYKTLNVYRFSKEFCQQAFKRLIAWYARAIDDNCYYELILGVIIYMQRAQIHAEILEGELWTEVDDPVDLDVAAFMFHPEARVDVLRSSHGGYWKYPLLDFNFIRNMYFPTGAVLSDLRSNLPALVHNYGSCQRVLDQKLAHFLDLPAAELVLLGGASQVFPWLGRRFDGRRVLVPDPSFGEYARVFPQAEHYADTGSIDLQRLAERTHSFELCALVNPNNPTGTTLATEALHSLIAGCPACLFVVDESFIRFSEQASLSSLVAARPLPNLLLIESLSKALGVPGLRLGFAFSQNLELLAELRASLPIWNLNSVAEYFLEVLFKHRRELDDSLTRTQADREEFAGRLAELPGMLRVWPSGANFLLCSLDPQLYPSPGLEAWLLNHHNILVKDLSERVGGPVTTLRLAVRTPAEHALLLQALQKFATRTGE